MERIARVSRVFRWMFGCCLVLLPVLDVLVWVFLNRLLDLEWMEMFWIGRMPLRPPIPFTGRMAGFLVSLGPLALQMAAVYYLYRLFGLYAKAEIFSSENVRCIRRVGYCLLIVQLVEPFRQALASVALTLHHPSGERLITIGISNMDIYQVIIGCMIIVVAWIMDEGRKLQEEQALVI